nr:MAG: replication-associated protein [Canine stool-associated circular virus]
MNTQEQAQGASWAGNTQRPAPKTVKRRAYFVTFWTHDYPRELPKNATYMCTCEDTTKDGKYHGHAFIYFKNTVTPKAVKKLFGDDEHDEKPIRNSDAINYVLNTEKRKHDFQEFGVRPCNNGQHRMEDIMQCKDVTEVMEMYPDDYVRWRKGIIDIMEHKRARDRYYKPPQVIWICGKTGKGKTRKAFEDGAVHVEYHNGFFDDWGDARIICIEELRGEIPYRTLLKLLDGYHNYYRVSIKGGFKFVDFDKIYITSPSMPEDIYRQQVTKEDGIEQLLRRITEIIDVGRAGYCDNNDL